MHVLRPVIPTMLLWALLLGARTAGAAVGDCGQPVSNSDGPTATDCLYILKSAVGTASCRTCVCDTNGSDSTTATDALVCLRDAVGQSVTLACPPCCAPPLAPEAQEFVDALLASLDQSQDFAVPPSCGTTTTVCCTDGEPIADCGPVHVDMISASFSVPSGQNRIDLVVDVRLKTVEDIPFTVPNVGNCTLGIDTTPGATATMRIAVPLTLAADGVEVESIGAFAISNLGTEDFTVGGAAGCQFANVALDFYTKHLQEILNERFAPMIGLCLGTS